MTKAKTVGAVTHTHTHTHVVIIEIKEGGNTFIGDIEKDRLN